MRSALGRCTVVQRLQVVSSLGNAVATPPPAICFPEVLYGKNVKIPDPCTAKWREFFIGFYKNSFITRPPSIPGSDPGTSAPLPTPKVASQLHCSLKHFWPSVLSVGWHEGLALVTLYCLVMYWLLPCLSCEDHNEKAHVLHTCDIP